MARRARSLTFQPRGDRLEVVHHGAVEAERPFCADAGRYEDQVEEAEVPLLVPFQGVGTDDVHETGIDGLSNGCGGRHLGAG